MWSGCPSCGPGCPLVVQFVHLVVVSFVSFLLVHQVVQIPGGPEPPVQSPWWSRTWWSEPGGPEPWDQSLVVRASSGPDSRFQILPVARNSRCSPPRSSSGPDPLWSRSSSGSDPPGGPDVLVVQILGGRSPPDLLTRSPGFYRSPGGPDPPGVNTRDTGLAPGGGDLYPDLVILLASPPDSGIYWRSVELQVIQSDLHLVVQSL